jgi:hydroxymethylbilane synthase
LTISAPQRVFRLGTRGSALARAQCDLVSDLIQSRHAGVDVETVIVRTEGDADKRSPLSVIGGHGVFTSALQDALRLGWIDAAVHSAKDLPSQNAPGLRLAAFLAREDPRDVLVTRHNCSLDELPPDPVIGTSSRRRATQIRHARPDAQIRDLRGNIDTRLKQSRTDQFDGIVVAAAGVTRMGWQHQISEYLPLERFVPAPGQGALAVEVRADTPESSVFDLLADPTCMLPVRVERAFLNAIGAGCTTPIGAYATMEDGRVSLRCMLASDDGLRAEWQTAWFDAAESELAAADLSRAMLASVTSTSVPSPTPATRRLPLQGKVVVVTRPASDAEELCRSLERVGAKTSRAPAIRVEPAAFDIRAVTSGLRDGRWKWIAFTSRNAVQGLLGGLATEPDVPSLFQSVRIAAVGKETADAIGHHGLTVDLLSPGKNAADLGSVLASTNVKGCLVLSPQGNLNRTDLANALHAAGATTETVEVYRTMPEHSLPAALLSQLQRDAVDAVTFTSPSSVREFITLLGKDATRLQDVPAVCIGGTTAAEAHRQGLRHVVVADTPDAEGIVAATISVFGQPGSRATDKGVSV